MKSENSRYKKQRDILIRNLYNNKDITFREIEEMLKKVGIDLSFVQISNICRRFEKND
jgi:hypothetical protein